MNQKSNRHLFIYLFLNLNSIFLKAKEQLLTSLNSQQNNLFSTFILLDNLPLKYLNGIVFDVFQSFDLKNKLSNNKPFIICTLNRTNLTEQLIIQKLQIHHNFHLCPLNQKMEAVNGLFRF